MKAIALAAAAALATAAHLASPPTLAQSSDAAKPPPGSAADHSASNASRARKPAYTKKFDLSALPDYKPEVQVSGKLRVWGANYIADSGLADRWKGDFNKYQPGVEFDFNLPSAAIAIPALFFDLADVVMDHEPTFYDYLAHLRVKGYNPTGVQIVTGSLDVGGWNNTIAIMVNKDNPLTKLTMKQLDGIFGSQRAGGWLGADWHPEVARGPELDIRTWDQLGVGGVCAGKRITPYGFSVRYATALDFSNRVLGGSDKWNGDLLAYGNWRRPDGTTYGQSDQIIDKLKTDRCGIGYARYQSRYSNEVKVLALAETDKGPYVDLTLDNVQSRKYPFWDTQSFYFGRKPGAKLDPKIREFLRYILSRQGQELVQQDGKYLPLTAAVVAEGREKLD